MLKKIVDILKNNIKFILIGFGIVILITITYFWITNLIEKNKPVKISDVSYKLNYQDNPVIKFTIHNKSVSDDLKNGIITFIFYNKKEVVHIYEYNLDKLDKDSSITIETVIDFKYTKLTSYKIKYNDVVVYKSRT